MLRTERKHIAFFLSSLRGGGAEKVFLHLARSFVNNGHKTDIVLSNLKGELVSEVPDGVRIIELGQAGKFRSIIFFLKLPFETSRLLIWPVITKRPKKLRSFPKLIDYLEKEKPDALFSTTNIPNLLSIWASKVKKIKTRIIIRQSNNLFCKINLKRDPIEKHLPFLIRHWYCHANAQIAVSRGVANEIASIMEVPPKKINVINNPIDIDQIAQLAKREPEEPWLRCNQPPVILSAGRFHPQKDFFTLLRSFKIVITKIPSNLIILGDGRERDHLQSYAKEIGIDQFVKFPGFSRNPYSYFSRASVFVLSSAWEGFPNVLLEALACGCPIVSTDCPSGPSELLQAGRYGKLVSVGDETSLAQAIIETIETPPNKDALIKRAWEFAIPSITERYLALLED